MTETTDRPDEVTPTLDQMAEELVNRGLATVAILGPRRHVQGSFR